MLSEATEQHLESTILISVQLLNHNTFQAETRLNDSDTLSFPIYSVRITPLCYCCLTPYHKNLHTATFCSTVRGRTSHKLRNSLLSVYIFSNAILYFSILLVFYLCILCETNNKANPLYAQTHLILEVFSDSDL